MFDLLIFSYNFDINLIYIFCCLPKIKQIGRQCKLEIFLIKTSFQLENLWKSSFKLSRVVRKTAFQYAKTKTQISFTVTAKLISGFVFVSKIVQSFYFLNTRLEASSHILWLHSPVCVGHGRKPRRPCSQNEAQLFNYQIDQLI